MIGTTRTLLLLGGTAEGRELAVRLRDVPDLRVVTSLAGRLDDPRLPAGEVRSGGFGGASGLAVWLRANAPALVVDATHPFAGQISRNALAACAVTESLLLRLQRPGWTASVGDRWLRVPDVAAAADLVPTVGRRPLLTTGRQDLTTFTGHPVCALLDLVVRCVEPPEQSLPARTTVLLARGPYTLDSELALLRQRGIDVLVTKDSGGDHTRAKLDAARELGVPVVMVERPPMSPGVATVASVAEAEQWVLDALSRADA